MRHAVKKPIGALGPQPIMVLSNKSISDVSHTPAGELPLLCAMFAVIFPVVTVLCPVPGEFMLLTTEAQFSPTVSQTLGAVRQRYPQSAAVK